MTSLRLAAGVLLIALMGALVGCAHGPRGQPDRTPQGPRPFGVLEGITGPNAFYIRGNVGQAVRVQNGQRVFEGDRIFTGAGTRMTLRFDMGGYAEFDWNTDPVPRFLDEFRCWVLDLFHNGRLFVDASNFCINANGALTGQASQVVYDMRSGHLQITVAGGQATVLRPRSAPIPAGSRLEANARQILSGPTALMRAEVENAVRWTRWYQQTKPVLPGRDLKGVVQ